MQRVYALWLCLLLSGATSAQVITVDDDGSADHTTIQAAIDASNNGDIIVVHPGTYTGAGNYNINFAGRAITVNSTDPQDQAVVAATIIDCGYQGRGFYFGTSEGTNSVLDGLTITNAGDYDLYDGGGIYCKGSSPTVANCRILSSVGYFGGGICNDYGSSPTLVNCVFSNNLGTLGGGMCNFESAPNVINCTFSGNTSDDQGGGMFCHMSNPTVTNCTFSGNLAYSDGGGILNNGLSDTMVGNCILWGNVPDEIYVGTGTATVNYSDVQGGYPGTGNIEGDPMFVEPGYRDDSGTPSDPYDDFWVDGDYHLNLLSPCVNAGDPDGDYIGWTDIDGDLRVRYGRVDMGAYELNTFCPTADLSGDHFVDFVDSAILADQWLEDVGALSADIAPDCGDGKVGIDDLLVLAENWLTFVQEPGVIGHWTMDDNASNMLMLDSTGNNHGTPRQNTSILHTTGQIDGALTFDGASDYIDLGSPAVLTDLPADDFTVSAWIYDVSTTGKGIIMGVFPDGTTGWILRKQGIGTDLYIDFWAGHSTTNAYFATPAGSLASDNWHHVAAVWDGAAKTCKIYINGFESSYVTSTAGEGGYNSDASYDKEMGRIAYLGGIQLFAGKMDDVKIFNKTLTSSEIQELYGSVAYTGYWCMDDDTDNTTVLDSSSNGNDGSAQQNTSILHTTGRIDGALTFDGASDYINLGSPAALTDLPADDFTVSAWIYDESETGKGIIIGAFPDGTAGWILRKQGTESARYLNFWAGHSVTNAYFATPAGSLASDSWRHVAAVWDAGTKTCKIYIDGFESSYDSSTSGEGSYNSDASYDKEMGRMAYLGGIQFFAGKIDDVKIFGRVLSEAEILQLATDL